MRGTVLRGSGGWRVAVEQPSSATGKDAAEDSGPNGPGARAWKKTGTDSVEKCGHDREDGEGRRYEPIERSRVLARRPDDDGLELERLLLGSREIEGGKGSARLDRVSQKQGK